MLAVYYSVFHIWFLLLNNNTDQIGESSNNFICCFIGENISKQIACPGEDHLPLTYQMPPCHVKRVRGRTWTWNTKVQKRWNYMENSGCRRQGCHVFDFWQTVKCAICVFICHILKYHMWSLFFSPILTGRNKEKESIQDYKAKRQEMFRVQVGLRRRNIILSLWTNLLWALTVTWMVSFPVCNSS